MVFDTEARPRPYHHTDEEVARLLDLAKQASNQHYMMQVIPESILYRKRVGPKPIANHSQHDDARLVARLEDMIGNSCTWRT